MVIFPQQFTYTTNLHRMKSQNSTPSTGVTFNCQNKSTLYLFISVKNKTTGPKWSHFAKFHVTQIGFD